MLQYFYLGFVEFGISAFGYPFKEGIWLFYFFFKVLCVFLRNVGYICHYMIIFPILFKDAIFCIFFFPAKYRNMIFYIYVPLIVCIGNMGVLFFFNFIPFISFLLFQLLWILEIYLSLCFMLYIRIHLISVQWHIFCSQITMFSVFVFIFFLNWSFALLRRKSCTCHGVLQTTLTQLHTPAN